MFPNVNIILVGSFEPAKDAGRRRSASLIITVSARFRSNVRKKDLINQSTYDSILLGNFIIYPSGNGEPETRWPSGRVSLNRDLIKRQLNAELNRVASIE